MKRFAPLALAASLALPANAQDTPMEDLLKRFEDLSKEAQTLMENWAEELAPKLEELGPALEQLAETLGDMSAYHPPEVLENGDIIIRRKTPLTPSDPPVPDTPGTGPIDL